MQTWPAPKPGLWLRDSPRRPTDSFAIHSVGLPHLTLACVAALAARPAMFRQWRGLFVIAACILIVTGVWAWPFAAHDTAGVAWSNAPIGLRSGGQVVASDVAPAPPSATPPAADHTLRGAPSLTAAQIASILRGYNSPAIGAAEALYALGLKYGVDPAYALAFFIRESSAGTRGVAITSRSIGNIRWTPDCGCANVEGYRGYPNWAAGIEDWYRLITGLYIEGWGLTTTDAIIPRYAPSADHNNPVAYIAGVNALVDGWRAGKGL